MKKKIQLSILLLLVFVTIVLLVGHWWRQSNETNDVEEVHELFDNVRTKVLVGTKLSFTSSEPDNFQNVMLYDYALLAAAPIVITDNNFKNDTIVAIDKIQNSSAKMYPNYRVITQKVGNKFLLRLMVKK